MTITETKRLGSTTFCRAAGISGPTMRLLEARGLLNPAKSDSGWRMFGPEDLAAVAVWKASGRTSHRRKNV